MFSGAVDRDKWHETNCLNRSVLLFILLIDRSLEVYVWYYQTSMMEIFLKIGDR